MTSPVRICGSARSRSRRSAALGFGVGASATVGLLHGEPERGDVDAAINAIRTAKEKHSFLGIDAEGHSCIVKTRGNCDGHVILRGGYQGPNFDPITIQRVTAELRNLQLPEAIVVDCSHDNSGKIAKNQEAVCRLVINERQQGYDQIVGIMLESNIKAGHQPILSDPAKLIYGVSITDDCLGWEQTEQLLLWAYDNLG